MTSTISSILIAMVVTMIPLSPDNVRSSRWDGTWNHGDDKGNDTGNLLFDYRCRRIVESGSSEGMKVLELFAGTRSIGKAFEEAGHSVYSIDWDRGFADIDLYADISTMSVDDLPALFQHPDVVWASPDCTTYSIAAISKHRRRTEDGNLEPISDYAKFCDKTNTHLLSLIRDLDPKYWFIENPRGGMRKMAFMRDLPMFTVTYCQYGDNRMKPTDIWTNHPAPQFKPPCKNGDPCHTPAPRGTRQGTQGLKDRVERARIPEEFCKHIVEICEVKV